MDSNQNLDVGSQSGNNAWANIQSNEQEEQAQQEAIQAGRTQQDEIADQILEGQSVLTRSQEGEEGSKTTSSNMYGAINSPALQQPQVDFSASSKAMDQLFRSAGFLNTNLASMVSSTLQPESTEEEEDPNEPAPSEDEPTDNSAINNLAKETGVSPQLLKQTVQGLASREFDEQLSALKPPPSPEEAAKLAAAFNNPAAASKLSPELQATLNKLISTVNAHIRQLYPFPASATLPPPDLEEAQEEQSTAYDAAVSNQLSLLALKHNLPPDQLPKLETIHYLPEYTQSAPENLKAIVQEAQQQALPTTQQATGLDTTLINPQSDSGVQNQILNGYFLKTVQQKIGSYQPPLTASQVAQVKSYEAAFLTNPDDPSIPANIKAILQNVVNGSIQAVISKYGLDSNWRPPILGGIDAADQAKISLAVNGLQTAANMITQAKATLNKYPTANGKSIYNYLETIGLAINNLENSIYAMQQENSNVSKILSKIKMQLSIDQNIEQANEQKELEAKGGKIAHDPFLRSFVKVMSFITAALTAGATTGVALATMDYVKPQDSQKMFAAMNKGMEKVFGKQFGAATAIAVDATVALVITSPIAAISVFFQDTGAIQNFVAACGGNKKQQMLANTVCSITAQLAVTIVMSVCSGGAAAPAEVTALAAKVLQSTFTALKDMESAMKVASRALRVTMMTVDLVNTGSQVAQSGISINNNVLQAEMAIIKGEMEAFAEKIQALITVFTKLIDDLLDTLNTNATWLTNLSKFQSDKYTQASNVSSQLFA